MILVDEWFTLTLEELGGDGDKLFDDSAFPKGSTVGLKGDEVVPVLVLGYNGGADGLRVVEDAIDGGDTSTFMQRNGNSSSGLTGTAAAWITSVRMVSRVAL